VKIDLLKKNWVMKEIHHRVKNNLQVMSSLLSLQVRKTKDDSTKIALTSSKSRVQAMSILHQNLYERDEFTELKSKNYFLDLVGNIKDIYHDRSNIKIITDLEELILDVDTLVPMGLVVNELICNAYKHAFNDREEGEISLSVKRASAESIVIKVKDNGKGALENYLTINGDSLGTKLITSFVKSLKGEIEVNNKDGLEVIIYTNLSKKKKYA